MKSFEDLVFMPEEGCSGDATFKAVAVFPNGYGVSVVFGNGTLTSSEKPYELAVIECQEDGSYRLIYPSILFYFKKHKIVSARKANSCFCDSI